MKMDNCPVCGANAEKLCAGCKEVKYCNVEHQRAHWKVHKNECRPFIVASDEDVGRYLLVKKDIPANSVILIESPLIVGPKWFLSEKEVGNTIVPCVGCFTPVQVGKYGCPNCSWPVCSPYCSGLNNVKLHALECPILAMGPGPSNGKSLKSLLDYYRFDALVVLKCLSIQKKFKVKWTKLMDMQSNENERKNSELYEDAENRIVSYLENNFLKRLRYLEEQAKTKIFENNDANILRKICGIIETNYMCINLPNSLELSGIYYTACMMEHSCMPNCYFTFDYKDDFKICVRAGRDIKKGEHLQIMYSNMLWGTQMRQEHLNLTKHFLCKCIRCRDKTEMGTYLSALKCMGPGIISCGGIQLPEDPLKSHTDWVCDKCPVRINSEEVRYLMTQMGEEVEMLISQKPTVKQIETLIDKLSQFLHTNHYHLFNLKHTLIQLYGNQNNYKLNDLSDEHLAKKITLCQNLLDICSKLDPYEIRLSLYVGTILKELGEAIYERGNRKVKLTTISAEDCNQAVQKDMKMAKSMLARGKSVLQKELDSLQCAKLYECINELEITIDKIMIPSKLS